MYELRFTRAAERYFKKIREKVCKLHSGML